MEQITNKYARVEIPEGFPTMAYSYLGKSKKPYKIYRFKTSDDLRLWATKWLDQVSTKMQVVEKDKLERKKQV
ncbi:MAG: hypothetical protein EBR82_68715, partial [Caulobacteraceae bacterium]|nr:hypothetical protein [Caulobacteraceae bacterium]